MSILVVGAGAFGTGLAIALGRKGPVSLWARDADYAQHMQATRENTRRLPGAAFPENLTVVSDIVAADIVLLAVPMQQLSGLLEVYKDVFAGKILVACCKGIDLETGMGPSEIIQRHVPSASVAILTGPSFAADIAAGLPTALTLACGDEGIGEHLQDVLSTSALRLYRTTDTLGAALGGALKNVIAIACGVAIGAGLGHSARAALMTRGFAEMNRFATGCGADPTTLAGLSGFGDLTLTCTSEGSRNYRYGVAIGSNKAFDASVTVEGVATARALQALAAKSGLDMPITRTIAGLVEGIIDVDMAKAALLSRPLREE